MMSKMNIINSNINLKTGKMKKVILALFVLSLTNVLIGQSDPVNDLFDKYAGKDGFTTVYISKDLLQLAAKLDPEDEDLEAISKINQIKILAQEWATDETKGVNFYDEIFSKLDKSVFKELMVVMEKDAQVNMLVREDDGVISEFLLVVGNEGENVLISIRGIIDLDELDEISDKFDFKCADKLKLAEEHDH